MDNKGQSSSSAIETQNVSALSQINVSGIKDREPNQKPAFVMV